MSRYMIVHVDGNKMWRELITDISSVNVGFVMDSYYFVLESDTLPDVELPEGAVLEYDDYLMVGEIFPPLPVYKNTVVIENGPTLSPNHFWINNDYSIPNFIMRRIVYNFIMCNKVLKTVYFYVTFNKDKIRKDSVTYENDAVCRKNDVLSHVDGIPIEEGSLINDPLYGIIDVNAYFLLNSDKEKFDCTLNGVSVMFHPKNINTLFAPLKRKYKGGYKQMNDSKQPLYTK